MEQSIFGGQSLQKYLADQWAYVEREVSELSAVADVDQVAGDLVDAHLIEPARLLRDEAALKPNESAEGIDLTVVIPIAGHARLLSASPSTLGRRPVIAGVWVEADRWLGDDNEPSRVILKRKFKGVTDSAEVREWAKSQVDLIEATLAGYAVEVDAFNKSVRGDVPTLVKQRQEILSATAKLRDELGKGI